MGASCYDRDEDAYAEFLRDDVVAAYGAPMFLKRLATTLSYPGLLDEALQGLICNNLLRIMVHPACVPYLHETGMFFSLRQAYDRQLEHDRRTAGSGSDSEGKRIVARSSLTSQVLLIYAYVKAARVTIQRKGRSQLLFTG